MDIMYICIQYFNEADIFLSQILDSSPKLKDHRGNQSKYQTYNNYLYLVFQRGGIITTLQPYFCSDIVH